MRLIRRVRSIWASTPLSTTGSTKPSRNLVFELQLRAIEREREQRAIDIAWRSGTWPKVLG